MFNRLIYSIWLLVILILLSILASFVFFKNPRKKVNQIFSAISIFCFLWALTFFVRYGGFTAPFIFDKNDYFFWAKISHIAGAFILAFVTYFGIVFPETEKKKISWVTTLLVTLVLPTFMTILVINDLIISGMINLYGTYFILPGPLYFVWFVYSIAGLISYPAIAYKKYKKVSGLKRTQLSYLLFGCYISAFIAVISNVLVPALSKVFPLFSTISSVHLIGPLALVFFLSFASVAIIKHRLMDIELVISRTVSYVFTTLVLAFFLVFLVSVTEHYLRNIFGYDNITIVAILAIFITFLFQPIQNIINSYFSKVVFKSKFEYRNALKQSIEKLVTKLNFEELVNFLLDSIKRIFETQKVTLILKKKIGDDIYKYKIFAYRGIEERDAEDFVLGEKILNWLKQRKEIFVKEEMEQQHEEKDFYEFYNNLSKIGAEILIPIFIDDELEGVLTIDKRSNGRYYSPIDIELLSLLSIEAAIAIVNARLYHQAVTDSLTGVYSRRYFDIRIKDEVNRAIRYQHSLSILMIDLDDFKKINDIYGHQVGDILLKNICNLILFSVRTVDIVFRYGGDEFVVMLPEVGEPSGGEWGIPERSRDSSLTVARRIKNTIEKSTFIIDGIKVKTSLSIGIVYCKKENHSELSVEKILRLADDALYEAKKNGKNRIEIKEYV